MINVRNVIILVVSLFLHHGKAVKENIKISLEATDLGGWRLAGETYHVCPSVGGIKLKYSTLILEFQKVYPAREVHTQIDYQIQSCSACSYVFGVSALLADHKYEHAPKFTDYNYTNVGNLKNNTAIGNNGLKIFTSTLSIDTKGKHGIYIAFSSSQTCGRILAIRMWYFTCPTLAGNLLSFPKRPAPSTNISIVNIEGKCVENSVPVSTARENVMMCYANGTAVTRGGCHCQAGYYMKSSHQCVDCLPKTYKPTSGNEHCFKCTKNVKDGLLPRKSLCQCLDGYFRPKASIDDFRVECEAPPSRPRALNATYVNSQWAVIEWKPPRDAGTGGPISYRIHCLQCDIRSYPTMKLSVNLTNLKTFSVYNITVSAMNNVTEAIGKRSKIEFYFKTLSGLPSSVMNLKEIRNANGSVTIMWDAPAATGGPDLQYYIVINSKPGFFSRDRTHRIEQQEKRMEYKVSVKSHTSAGCSEPVYITFVIEGKAKGVPMNIAIGVGIAFAILLIIAICCMIIFYRRRHPSHVQTVRLEDGTVKLPKFGGNRVYVEPTTYQDVTDAVREFANELDRNWVELGRIIGGGEFGDVYQGTLQRPLEDEIIVAVKTLKGNANKKASDDFLSEAAYMGQFDDPNVIALEGVVVKGKPIMILIEFMSNGSLETYLQANDSRFSSLQLLGMARGVSSGMTYLSELSFIHRDLAARNILVNENMVCKVADFGMSRELSEEEAYSTAGGKIPVRWTAPEAIQYKKFTSASDVWSYGILLWEIMSYGERPYWDWGNYEVIERLASGYRLPPPMGCPKVVHDLMLTCWLKDRIKRPKFREIRATIDKWIRSPELLKQEASVVTKRDENLDYAAMRTLKEWLDSINMGQYLENFTNQSFVTPRQILEITEDELKELGVLAVGHRKKILKSVKATRDQLSLCETKL